jgi:hypothetical protein
MAAGHGGARPGSGPKPGTTKPEPGTSTHYADALAYLEAVVRGDELADGLRIAAAKVVLPYQQPKRRAPIASPPPQKLRAATERAADRLEADDFEKRAAEVRRRLAAKKGTP